MGTQPAITSGLKLGITANGYRLRIDGKGTMRQSPAALTLGMQCHAEPHRHFALDLSSCDYLDSTFQGCLLQLQKAFGRGPDSRFTVSSPSDACRKLLAGAHVDRLLKITSTSPAVIGEELCVNCDSPDPDDLSRHIMVCHHQLAEAGGPQQQAFQKIADQIGQDLQRKGIPAKPC